MQVSVLSYVLIVRSYCDLGLSALIIHAVADLVASPTQSYSFWRVSPFEFLIFFAAVIATVFSTIEIGIYTSISASVALLLIRIARPRGTFLGRVVLRNGSGGRSRDAYIPFATARGLGKHQGVINPDIKIQPPSPGVVIYRFEESFLYPNSSYVTTVLLDYVRTTTRRGGSDALIAAADRPWNDPGLSLSDTDTREESRKPVLKAVVLDLSAVGHLDTTSVQNLIDTRFVISSNFQLIKPTPTLDVGKKWKNGLEDLWNSILPIFFHPGFDVL